MAKKIKNVSNRCKKIINTSERCERISVDEVAEALGAEIVSIPRLNKKESEQYEQLGSPVMVPKADELYIYHFGSRMLSDYGQSLDDVVGYRVLDWNEEVFFREECGDSHSPVVYYYGETKE